MSHVRWLAPSPLWDDLVGKPAGFRAPALLRFAGDDFIPQYQAALAEKPRQLRGFVARPETWREPAAGMDAAPKPSQGPLRLYQPVHGRFYLVAASLACRVPGLPEHTVDVAKGEVVAFVVRRLTVSVDPATKAETETGEWAWVARPDGSTGWVKATGAALAAHEDQLPMFGTTFSDGGVLKRRLFAGLVPVSRREAFVSGRERDAGQPAKPEDEARLVDFQRAVIDPWVSMQERWTELNARTPRPELQAEIAANEASSALMLVDFAEFLERWLPAVWAAVLSGSGTGLAGGRLALFDTLRNRRMWSRSKLAAGSWTLAEALRQAWQRRADFDALTLPSTGTPPTVPSGFRPVLWTDPGTAQPSPAEKDPSGNAYTPNADFASLLALLTRDQSTGTVLDRPLARLVRDALAEVPAQGAMPQLPALAPANAQGSDWFTIRCVYLRPHCGKKSPPLVSDRSERFRLASFFEPDAPARQLRVALPVDTSPATLRKYDRNVAFMLSDQLRKQMSRAANLKDLMDGKAGPGESGLDFSVICSFSIPIITICAMILLMIIVSLLNIIFWWLPLFKICFPVPSLKSKG